MKLTKVQIQDIKEHIDTLDVGNWKTRDFAEVFVMGATYWDDKAYDILMDYIQKASE